MQAKQVSIELEGISGKTLLSLKSAAIVTTATRQNGNIRSKWVKKRSCSRPLGLEAYMYEDSVSIITLVVEGKLNELKNVLKEHDMTLSEVDIEGRTLLHHATLHNQQLIMSFLIHSGINLDAVDNIGNTALHLATEKDLPDACHLLLTNGASDSILNKDVYAPLHLAAQGKNKALEAILDHPVEFSVAGHRSKTPMHIICENDNIEGIILMQKKVMDNVMMSKNRLFKICATDDNGLTPIHLAARKNSHRVLNFIIQCCTNHGYTIETVLGFLDEENSTPLHAAVDSCNTEVVKVLLEHGASPTDSKGNLIPPLHLACSQGRSDMVRMMVERAGPQIILSTDQELKTPLHHCALSVHSSCMIPFLVERGKGIIQIDARDARGRTPLHNAVTSANLAGTKELIFYGSNPLVKDCKGLNALHLALNSNRKVIVNVLLELPCAAELISNTCCRGYSAIHHALHVGQGGVIPKMIAALQFEVKKMRDDEGNSYLHLAAGKGDIKALKALLDVPEIHKLLNEPNDFGITPLHSAATGGHYQCIDLLLNNGAMFHKAFNGETAFMIACKKGFTNCARLLIQSHPCQIAMTDNIGNSALHAASQSLTPSMITLLLDKNCKLSINSESLSFLDMLIDCGHFDCVMAVINHGRWQECLDFGSPSRTCPILRLIEQMPKAAKAVLDRCHSRANLDKSHPDYWEKFDFKYLYCQKTIDNKSHRGLAFAIHPSDKDDITETTIKYKGNVQRTSVVSHDLVRACKKRVCFGQDTMMNLRKMKHFKRQALLTHPVVSAFLKSKWQRYGSIYCYSLYALHLLLTVLLSIFVIIVPNPVQQLISLNETEIVSTAVDDPFELSPGATALRALALVVNIILIAVIAFNVLVHVYLQRSGGFSAFFQVSTWFDFLSVTITFIFFVFPNPLHVWSLGAVGCFFSWFSLLLALEHFSLAGTIVKMFLEVTKTVFFVLSISIFLLLAFAFPFYMLAGSLSEFNNVGYALLSVFGFMLGELPYDMYVKLDVAGNLPSGSLVLVFILFLAILMSIVLANLLIGLAVGDIERVKLNAIVQRKAIEIEFFSQVDASIPRRYLKSLSLPSSTIYPNKNRSIYSKWQDSWNWIEAQIESEQSENLSAVSVSSTCLSEITELKLHVLEMKETQQQMQEANALLRRHYRGLSARSSFSSLEFDPIENLAGNIELDYQ